MRKRCYTLETLKDGSPAFRRIGFCLNKPVYLPSASENLPELFRGECPFPQATAAKHVETAKRVARVFKIPGHLLKFLVAAFAAYAKDELSADRDIAIDAGEARELRELKQIVNGIREEMRYYLANGNGTPRSFWRRLNERTAQEMQIYERTRRELENETSPDAWESKNEALRRIGLRTIANPKEQE